MTYEVLTAVKIDVTFLGCNAVWTYRYVIIFPIKILPPFSRLVASQPRKQTQKILKPILDKFYKDMDFVELLYVFIQCRDFLLLTTIRVLLSQAKLIN
jgi:hypothetical protein